MEQMAYILYVNNFRFYYLNDVHICLHKYEVFDKLLRNINIYE